MTENEQPAARERDDSERAQAQLDSERLRQLAEWLAMEHGHEETAKRVNLIAERHDRLALAVFEKAHTPTAPTDDDREALTSAAHEEADQRYGMTDWTDGPGSSTFRRVDRGKAGAFVDGALWRDRRCEVPEPSAGLIAMLRAWIDGEPFEVSQERTGQPAAKVPFAQQQGYFNGYAAAVDHVAAILAAAPEPQGEPSDAQGWNCGKRYREVALGHDDGQIPMHHRSCQADARLLAAANAYLRYQPPYDDLTAFSAEFLRDMRAALRAAGGEGR